MPKVENSICENDNNKADDLKKSRETFLNFGEFWLAAQPSQPSKSLQNSKIFTKKVKIWFDEFFENTSTLSEITVLKTSKPFANQFTSLTISMTIV